MNDFEKLRLTIGVLATLGLYSVLFKENKFYRVFEHIFVGLATGWALVSLWTETLKQSWWDVMVGSVAEGTSAATPGFWAYIVLLPISLLGYLVFSQKHNWLSRIPIGLILGFWSGQQIQIWWNRYGPQIDGSLKPILPNTTESFFVPSTANVSPERAAEIANNIYPSQVIGNLMFVITLVSVLSYFLFSFDIKSKFLQRTSLMGRWLLMIGFGAIFGSTVMMRFTLLIDRMYFIWIEWLTNGMLGRG